MRSFESHGLWYLPGHRERPVAGQLRYSPSGGLILTLTGSLTDISGIHFPAATYPVVHGLISDSPYGRHVTLIDCFQREITLSMQSFVTEELRANRAYIGSTHLASEGQSTFTSVTVHYTHIEDWVGLSGIQLHFREPWSAGSVSLEYQRPDPIQFQLDGAVAALNSSVSTGPTFSGWAINERVLLKVSTSDNSTAPDLLSSFVMPLQDLLTFALDRATSIDEISFLEPVSESPPHPQPLHLLFQPVHQTEKDVRRLQPDEMLFGWADLVSSHPQILSAWLVFRRQFKSACDIFFGLQYCPPAYLESKFLLLLLSISHLLVDRAVVPPEFVAGINTLEGAISNQRDRLWIKILPATAELSLPWALSALINSHAELLEPIIGEPESFVTELVLAKSKLFAGPDPREQHRSQQLRLLRLIEIITLLLKVGVFDALGFSPDEIRRLVGRNRRYVSLLSGFPK